MSSAPAKPFVAQHSVPVGVTSTRWWWVRHAPVREDGGNIYGQYDIGCDCSDTVVFQGVAKFLPQNALWFSSNLKRTHQTAAAIWAAGLPRPDRMHQDRAFAEQDLGEWQGMNRAAFFAARPASIASYWFAPAHERAPGGESFNDLVVRATGAIERLSEIYAGRDIVAVAHGGTIKAAIAHALNLSADAGLAFACDNCSVTRLERLSVTPEPLRRVIATNHRPWVGMSARQAASVLA